MKIVFLDRGTLGDADLGAIAALGDLVCYESTDPGMVAERLSGADVAIINKVVMDAAAIDSAPSLRLICEAATGVNNIDVQYAESKGIAVRNVAGYSTMSVVQMTFTHILSLVGRLEHFDAFVKSGEYSRRRCFTDPSVDFEELDGKTIGIIGMGAIGSRVACVAESFGMKVVYFSTSGTSHCTAYPSLPLDELLKVSDVVSIHAPLNDRTRGLIGARELSLMKKTAVLVNAGRGGIVDETALAAAVDEGTIAGTGFDVFAIEPVPADSPLLHMAHPERLSLSPHIAWASAEAKARLVRGIASNIIEFIDKIH